MHIFPLLGYLSLLTTSAVLLVAFLRVQRTNRDLTDQLTQAREQQHQHTLQLTHRSELDTLKDEFISTVSHELRTPLTSIRGALGLLSSGIIGDVDAKALNLLRIAVTNTDRLIRLINDILDLERMESGRAPLQIRRCSLRDLAQQAIDTMTPMADANTVHLALEPSTVAQAAYPEALFFDGDADRILQVLTNLLSNAIKFSPAASTVRIHTEAASDSILLKVVDEGRGIPSDKLDSIFDRFQQIEPSDARQKGGTGLGLAICRSIVQQHSGSIWAQRNLGPGTTLYMMLPRTTRATDVAVPAQLPPRGEGAILVCDDDAGIRTVVAEHLTRQGYTVVEASSGEQALILAAEHHVEAILLDLYMPGLSGWETLQRLRNNPITANIPVVVLSVLSSTLRPQLTGDAQGWVQKPFNENLLFAELGRVLHQGEGPAYVLLVEDDEDLASVLTASFQDAAVHVDHAATRQQAIRQCITRPPDLLILDLTLPDGDGFSLVEWLRQQPTLRTMPLVVYSGREMSEGEMAKLRLGPTEFLTKAKVQPQEVEELVLSMVHRLRTKFADLATAGPAA
ncbi:response regulator [Tunturiibacter empetritectus]|uniref:histidine kinase n=2 Tax=Tunturiibacter TaxID=3154218 RepID=A0A852VIK2_9BACT|nr:response regulator [Edaphobacter lichenicola]NYF89322.1 signal transduction histidine kinase/CheY-like chemotaxis protein [Edaphobacter lichenicola]